MRLIFSISQEQAQDIIRSGAPRGLYIAPEGDKFLGLDNTTGEAWAEIFWDRDQCLAWLRRAKNAKNLRDMP